jgi:hypothetical protein
MRASYLGILGASVLVGSFLITLWLTAPTTLPDIKPALPSIKSDVFAAYLVPDESMLSAAASAAGLQPSDTLKGFVDAVTRLDSTQVKIHGWAADLKGGDPILVLVFANGKIVLKTQTKGPRPDVADALKLSKDAASNAAFEGLLSCKPGQRLFVVAVTQTDLYAALGHARPLICPRKVEGSTSYKRDAQPPSSSTGRPPNEAMASYKISNRTELIEAAAALGLHASSRMKGNIDAINRINDREVTIAGWVADLEGDDTPLNVLVFVNGAMVGAARTQGERPDVTTAHDLAFGAEKNVALQAMFACRSGDQPIVVGVGVDEDYLLLTSPRCP